MRQLTVFVSFLLCTTLTVTAQVNRNVDIPLKNWPAPAYWQPSQTETQAAGLRPELKPAQSQASSYALVFVAMTPCRVVDTRASQGFPSPFGPPSLVANATRSFPIQGNCTIPSTAQAYSFNVTVVPPAGVGYLKIWPTGVAEPNAVTLDDITGDIRNNAAIVPAGTPNGSVDVKVNATTDLVLDINGYYAVPNPTVNTANGLNALAGNTSGTHNTADGYGALFSNTTGSYNTASGALALNTNTTGNYNTASGFFALQRNSTGSANTAIGDYALSSNTIGGSNTATGYNALISNTTGSNNTASGSNALHENATGGFNTANGTQALFRNATGYNNTASGSNALFNNTTGINNTASGVAALESNTTGGSNIAVGNLAGINIATTSNNIDIGNQGSGGDNGVIRIGTSGTQTAFFAAGIAGVMVSGSAVLVDAMTGQLGTMSSSRRYKEHIEDMADSSSGLLRLRPVKFRYRKPYADGSKPIDYGLIAEEVAEVYPDLVVKNAEGGVETVQYQKLTPMLLNELQKEHETVRALQAQVATLQKEQETAAALQAQVSTLQKALETLAAKVQSSGGVTR